METIFEYTERIYNELAINTLPDDALANFIIKNPYKDLIHDDDNCLKFIELVIGQEITFEYNKSNKYRASHTVITCLLGFGLGEFYKINKYNFMPKTSSMLIWMLSAMLHDYGYFCCEVRKSTSLDKYKNDYYLLQDNYNVDWLKSINGMSHKVAYNQFFAFSYDEIERYYDYRLHALSGNKKERCDHGILGGCKAFYRYCMGKLGEELPESDLMKCTYKIACVTTASHNVFKSSIKNDREYKKYGLNSLLSTSPKRVTKDKKLLLLLSLVDTIECTKTFAKKENNRSYLQQSTTINKVKIGYKNGRAIVDYSDLYNHILRRSDENMMKSLEKQICDVVGLSCWTDFETKRIDKFSVEVGL